jgi:hypothetical protein
MTTPLARIRRASTWCFSGCLLHMLWITLLVLWFGPFGLEASVVGWVRAHRSPNQSGPAFTIPYGYLVIGLASIVTVATISFIIAYCFVWRDHRAERRVKRGLCPVCAYPVGPPGSPSSPRTSDVCTECGTRLTDGIMDAPAKHIRLLIICVAIWMAWLSWVIVTRPRFSPARFERIQLGMTEAEVKQLVGSPDGELIDHAGCHVLWYGDSPMPDKIYSVGFRNGHAVDIKK